MRNSLRPVNRLPPEVLASCATFVSDNDPRPIVPLTHVCRFWRRSICSNPKSWASISTAWKQLAPLCLERAGVVPLVVDITDIGHDKEDLLKQLLPHTSKISCLRLTGFSFIGTLEDDLPGFLDSPMPDLTSLELQQVAEPSETFPSGGTPVPVALQNVSKLTSLRLTRTPIYPTLLSIASLRELELLGYKDPFNFSTFIGFLRSNTDLERVVLGIQFVADSVETGPARKFPLSRLQHLSITCTEAIDPKRLFSCISLPRGAHVEVVSANPDPIPSLSSSLPSPQTPIHDLLAPITTIKLQAGRQELQLFGNGSSFTFRSTGDPLDAYRHFTLFPTAPVRELYIDTNPHGFTAVGLSKVVKHLPALEVLAISNSSVILPGLFSVLAEKPVLCPALKTIAFFDCGIGSDQFKGLEEAIAKRGDSTAARVYRVVIVSSTGKVTLDRASILQLRKSVPCVDIRVDDKLPDLT